MNSIKSFFAGVAVVLSALLALFFMRPRKQGKPLTQEAQEAIDKLKDIETREAINAELHGKSDADIVLDYIAEQERKRGENSESE